MFHVTFEAVPGPAPRADLTGAGTVELTAGGVHLRGHRRRRVLPALAGALTGLLTLAGAAVGLVALDLEDFISGKEAFLVGLLFGVLPGVIVHGFLARNLRGPPVDALVPGDRLQILHAHGVRLRLRFAADTLAGDVLCVFASADQAAQVMERYGGVKGRC